MINEQDSDREKSPESRWSGIAIPAAVAAVPLIVATVRLYVFANGDRQVLDAILAGVNLGTLWIALAVSLVPLVALTVPVALLFATVVWQSHRNLEVRRSRLVTTGTTRWFVAAFILSVALSWLFVNGWPAVLGPIAVLAIALSTRLGDAALDRREDETRAQFARRAAASRLSGARMSRTWAWIATPAVPLLALFTGTIGLPIEFVRVESEPALSAGYVVGVDDTMLTLAYLGGGVRKIPTDQVEGRFVCPTHSPVGGLTSEPRNGAQVLLDTTRSAPPYVPPECVTPNIRTR